jgi:hypothetical protein
VEAFEDARDAIRVQLGVVDDDSIRRSVASAHRVRSNSQVRNQPAHSVAGYTEQSCRRRAGIPIGIRTVAEASASSAVSRTTKQVVADPTGGEAGDLVRVGRFETGVGGNEPTGGSAEQLEAALMADRENERALVDDLGVHHPCEPDRQGEGLQPPLAVAAVEG